MRENILLKSGSVCILIGGILANLISIMNSVTTMLAMSVMDENTLDSLDRYILQESDGLFSSTEALGAAKIAVIVVIGFAAVGLLVSIVVGIMGLSRSKNLQKYKFFLGWGVVLLVIGFFSRGELFSLRGIFAAVGGIVGPILYIVGGIQQNRAANAETSGNTEY